MGVTSYIAVTTVVVAYACVLVWLARRPGDVSLGAVLFVLAISFAPVATIAVVGLGPLVDGLFRLLGYGRSPI